MLVHDQPGSEPSRCLLHSPFGAGFRGPKLYAPRLMVRTLVQVSNCAPQFSRDAIHIAVVCQGDEGVEANANDP